MPALLLCPFSISKKGTAPFLMMTQPAIDNSTDCGASLCCRLRLRQYGRCRCGVVQGSGPCCITPVRSIPYSQQAVGASVQKDTVRHCRNASIACMPTYSMHPPCLHPMLSTPARVSAATGGGSSAPGFGFGAPAASSGFGGGFTGGFGAASSAAASGAAPTPSLFGASSGGGFAFGGRCCHFGIQTLAAGCSGVACAR